MAAASEPARPPPAMTTSVCRNCISSTINGHRRKSSRNNKTRGVNRACDRGRSIGPEGAAADHGESRINARREFSAIVIYRIDNSLMLMVGPGASPNLRTDRHFMPTQAIFDGQLEDVLGPKSEELGAASPAAISSTGRLPVELSLHHDLASIESDWRAF